MDQSSIQPNIWLQCSKHPKKQYQFIHISDTSGQPLNCVSCLREKGIQLKDALLISEIMDDDNSLFLCNFPPLADERLYEQIRKTSQLQSEDYGVLQQIDTFFSDLQSSIDKAINVAKSEAKQKYMKHFQMKNDLSKVYDRISFTQELKSILKQEKDVSSQISEILKKVEDENAKNTQILNEFFKSNEKIFHFEIPTKSIDSIINSISEIRFFSEDPTSTSSNLLLSSNLIKSAFKQSQQLEISKTEQSGFIVKSLNSQNGNKIAYFDFILDPNKLFVLRVSTWMKTGSDAYILFGLIDDTDKDSSYLRCRNMCYCERKNEYGMGKQLKGGPLHKGNQQDQEISREFEMRIHLKNKFVKVTDFPNYSSVCELDDSNKINLNSSYRFAMELYYESSIAITSILEVGKFDDKI